MIITNIIIIYNKEFACHDDCINCYNQLTCIRCKDSNASPNSSEGCSCNEGFFNNSYPIKSGTCKSCGQGCKKCYNSGHCESCYDINSEPSTDGTCQCKENFYQNNGSCTECHPDCKSCNQSNICTECSAPNSILNGSNCECLPGYTNSSNSEKLECSHCPSNKIIYEGECLDCPLLCEECNGSCLWCVENSRAVSAFKCECKDGYEIRGNSCISKSFNATILVKSINEGC